MHFSGDQGAVCGSLLLSAKYSICFGWSCSRCILPTPRVPCVEAPAGRSRLGSCGNSRGRARWPRWGQGWSCRPARRGCQEPLVGAGRRAGAGSCPEQKQTQEIIRLTGQMERFAGRGWIARGRERRRSSPLCFQRKCSPRGGARVPCRPGVGCRRWCHVGQQTVPSVPCCPWEPWAELVPCRAGRGPAAPRVWGRREGQWVGLVGRGGRSLPGPGRAGAAVSEGSRVYGQQSLQQVSAGGSAQGAQLRGALLRGAQLRGAWLRGAQPGGRPGGRAAGACDPQRATGE